MNNFSDLKSENLLLFEILQRARLRTVGIASHFYFVRAPTVLEGFDLFDNLGATREIGPSNKDIASPRIVPRVEQELASLAGSGKRFAMFIHLFEPHSTYMEHQGWPITERGIPSLVQKYDYEIAYVDGFVGRILDALEGNRLKDKTMVVLLSDHGEAFGSHRFAGQTMFFHGQTLYDELLRVPLLVRLPGIAPAVVDAPVSLVDVAPTILDALGIDPAPLAPELEDAPFMGRSLLPAMQGKPLAPRPQWAELLPERGWNHSARALVAADGSKKIIYVLDDKRFEVYDLAADPGEKKNLVDRVPELSRDLERQLTDWMDGL
jgi:arylsulfatase A-like enzyme